MYKYQMAAVMREQGLTISQIAERLGVQANSVRITLIRYGTPERHAAYRNSMRSQVERDKARERRRRKRASLDLEPWCWPVEFRADIIRRREVGEPYRKIASELKVTVGVISGIMHRHRKSSKAVMENA